MYDFFKIFFCHFLSFVFSRVAVFIYNTCILHSSESATRAATFAPHSPDCLSLVDFFSHVRAEHSGTQLFPCPPPTEVTGVASSRKSARGGGLTFTRTLQFTFFILFSIRLFIRWIHVEQKKSLGSTYASAACGRAPTFKKKKKSTSRPESTPGRQLEVTQLSMDHTVPLCVPDAVETFVR